MIIDHNNSCKITLVVKNIENFYKLLTKQIEKINVFFCTEKYF